MLLYQLALAVLFAVISAGIFAILPKLKEDIKKSLSIRAPRKASSLQYEGYAMALAMGTALAITCGYFLRSPYFASLEYFGIGALALAIGEEIFFRGILKKYIGNAGQAFIYAALIAWPFSADFSAYVANCAALALLGFSSGFVEERYGLAESMFMRLVAVAAGLVALLSTSFLLSLLLFLIPFAYYAYKKLNLSETLAELGLAKMPVLRLVAHSVGLFLITVFAMNFLVMALGIAGIADEANAAQKVTSQSALTLLIAATFGPIAEEVFFRGLLRNKLGTIPSAILFGIGHFAYNSWVQVIAAVVLGLILGEYVRREHNILPAIVVHAAYNAISILALTA